MALDKNNLIALINTNLPDNDTQGITPAGVREVLQQMVSSDLNLDESTGQSIAGPITFEQKPAGLESGYVVIGGFVSEALQAGVSDTPKNVIFGAGGTTTGGEVTVDANGEITLNVLCYIAIKQRFRAGRIGASGVSDLFFWAEVSLDDGATWNVTGNAIDLSLDSSSEVSVFFDVSFGKFPVGTKLRNRFARSGDGDDSGDLTSSTPSAALTALGVPIAPSAQITIYKVS